MLRHMDDGGVQGAPARAVPKTTAVVFSTSQGRDVAQSWLATRIGARALIVAPKELATDEWVRQVIRHCTGGAAQYYTPDDPIEILAFADELGVIGNEPAPDSGSDVVLSQGAEDLLWLALEFGLEATYFHADGTRLANPRASLQRRGAPARTAARKAQRAALTRGLTEIRIYNDYCSSGLWENGSLRYGQLDLPLALVRKVAAWQQDFDDTVTPPDRSSKEWWERHDREELEIAGALQAALGAEIPVKVYRGRWLTVGEIDRAQVS